MLKKDLIIKVGEHEIIVPVNFELIEKVERVYGCTAEVAAAVHLSDPMRIQRRMISAVISLFVQGRAKGVGPSEVTESVMTCSQKQLAKYTGQIQAAVLYSIRGEDGQSLITPEQFDLLVNGEDLPPAETKPAKAQPEKKPAKPRAATSAKRT